MEHLNFNTVDSDQQVDSSNLTTGVLFGTRVVVDVTDTITFSDAHELVITPNQKVSQFDYIKGLPLPFNDAWESFWKRGLDPKAKAGVEALNSLLCSVLADQDPNSLTLEEKLILLALGGSGDYGARGRFDFMNEKNIAYVLFEAARSGVTLNIKPEDRVCSIWLFGGFINTPFIEYGEVFEIAMMQHLNEEAQLPVATIHIEGVETDLWHLHQLIGAYIRLIQNIRCPSVPETISTLIDGLKKCHRWGVDEEALGIDNNEVLS